MPDKQKVTRKLSAILSADVKGYSVLMADDEIHTIDTLKLYRQILSDLVSEHSGRVVDSPGDNILAEFRSSVDAVECAVKIQKRLDQENSKYVDDKKIQFRIGVNVGDVIQDGDRIYGNGVNVAARIEGLADPGGVCISRNAYDHISDKLNFGYEYLGEHSVKNIKKPVRVYKLLIADEDAGKLIGDVPKLVAKKWIYATAVLAVVVIASVVWQVYQKMNEPEFEPASVEEMAFPLPEKPSIAVLAFDNLSGDPEQDFFSDGLSEDIITALSKSSQIFVIARNSSFTYKGKPVKVQQVAEELGVRYVLEGSVRKDTDRVRITAQLIDAVKGVHLWAERYDRELKDIFAIQDDITKQIIAALHVKLTIGEDARLLSRGTNNLEAYLKVLEGNALLLRFNKDDNARARRLYEESIALDANYLPAYIDLAWTHLFDASYGWSESRTKSLETAYALAQKALSIDKSFAGIYATLGSIHLQRGEMQKALALRQKAVALEPNSANYHGQLGTTYLFMGERTDEAIAELNNALRLDPLPPTWILQYLGTAYRVNGEYDKAVELLIKAVQNNPNHWLSYLELSASYGFLGREEEAQAAAAEVLRIDPNFSTGKIMIPFRNEADKKRTLEVMRKAGLPEQSPGKEPPDKPSIAVLPFDNLSDVPEQEYFIDGIAEDIITALSKTDKLLVIARNSTFTYKNKPTNVKTIAQELDVRYVLEGSVRRDKDRVRITAQLIDALTGHHLWAERYDRNLENIFALQDEITLAIIRAMQVELTDGEQARVTGKDTENLDAYLKALKAHDQFHLMNREGSITAKQLANEALMLDPNYAFPYATLANAHMLDVWFGYSESREESMRIAAEAVQKALSLDPSDPKVYHAVTNLYCMQGQYEKAITAAEYGIKMGPHNAEAYFSMGNALMFFYKNKEAIPFYEQAIRLDPYPSSVIFRALGSAYMGVGRYEDAVAEFKKALQLKPDDMFTHLELASTYVRLGREDEARIEAKEVLRITSDFSVDDFAKSLPDPEEYPGTADYIESLRKAGLPD